MAQVDDISIRRALALPLLLMGLMMASAAAVSLYTGVSGYRVFWPYVSGWAAATLISALIWAAVETARMAMRREDNPTLMLVAGIRGRLPLFLIPALIFPLFLGAYTWAKSSIPFIVGYPWERVWLDLDYFLLGADAWQLAHAMMPSSLAGAWTFFYAIVWGFGLVFSGALIAAFGSRRLITAFYTAMMLSWLFGGFVLAYALSAAGPVFAHLVDPALEERFAPLRAQLLSSLGSENIVLQTQRYLTASIEHRIAIKGSGISAMPSMHMATATIIVFAALRTKWLPMAILFWVMTFYGSVYLGYHYAVDAPVAACVAATCWLMTQRIYPSHRRSPKSIEMAALGAPA